MTSKSSGFTLIELLVVVALIGIISAIGIVSYNGYVNSAKKICSDSVAIDLPAGPILVVSYVIVTILYYLFLNIKQYFDTELM